MITRRNWMLATGAAAAPGTALGATADDGAARRRGLAPRGACLDLAQAGQRLVAVGERGHVLLSDDHARQWRQAAAVPTRNTLTAVYATDPRTLWAVGHGGVVLRSGDAGENWSVVAGRTDAPDVLLSIRVEPDGAGLAVGGFGFALSTADAGKIWRRIALLPGEAGERHLNRIFVSAQGTWLIAAEGGHILRSTDRGASWSGVKTPYSGSLWSGAALGDGVLLACGMRGNVVRSVDDGRSWTHQAVPNAGSLCALAELPDRRTVLVGTDGTLLTAAAGAQSFSFRRLEDRATLTGVIPLTTRELAVASMAGVRIVTLDA
jgi:photosystem II stability/assembly factor-like uncharacterized protein